MNSIELIEEIRSGRNVRSAQEALYAQVRAALLPRLAAEIPAKLKPRLDAEDVLDEAFLRALAALPDFHPENERSFSSWVHRIARNLIADQSKRRSVAAVHFAGREGERGPDPSALPNPRRRNTTDLRDREWVQWAMEQLPPKEREVIRLRRLLEWSYEEIAAAWKSTSGAVRRYHARAWQKLCKIARRSSD